MTSVSFSQKSATSRPATNRFSLRLTAEERALLEQRAGSLSLSDYARARLFGPGERKPRRQPARLVADYQAVAQILALLGKSGAFAALDALGKEAATGSLIWDEQAAARHAQALADLAAIKAMLMTALRTKAQ